MSESGSSGSDRIFANYNVRYTELDASKPRAWAKSREIRVNIFENFDGGGFNFYVCEFETLYNATLFRTDFCIEAHNSLWGEDAEGQIHYL